MTGAFLLRYGDPAKARLAGLFHSISAFNNAGFDLMGGFQSLSGFASDPLVLVPIGGADRPRRPRRRDRGRRVRKRRWIRLALETKLVARDVGRDLIVGGMLALLASNGPTPARSAR